MPRRLTSLLIAMAITLSTCTTPTPTVVPTAPPPTQEPPATREPSPTNEPTAEPIRIDTTGLIREPVSEADRANADAIQSADLPVSDLRDLAIRYKGLPADTPEKTCAAPREYNVDDQEVFNVFNTDTLERFKVTATLVVKEPNAYMWVDNNWRLAIDRSALAASTREFDQSIIPRNRQLFGMELSPGIDCDARIHILNTSNTGAGGYVSSIDRYVRAVREDSNEREMFYVDIEKIGPESAGTPYYSGVMAHEFQHVILSHQDPNEDIWLNEGMSELAIFLNGHDRGSDFAAAAQPDIQLNDWPQGGVATSPYYGTAFSFMLYVWDRYGEAGVRALAAEPANGLDGIQNVLKQIDPGKQLDDFVADWLVARYLDNPQLEDGRYGYARVDRALIEIQQMVDAYPFEERTGVNQFAGKYVAFQGDDDVAIDFVGSTKARIIEAEPHGGQYYWWSNRGDDANLRLTREVDLSSVDNATLTYWTWFDIETDWDYGYVAASDDGGTTWDILTTPSGTDHNPIGNNLGWGYTGSSGDQAPPVWIQESIDLAAYAGKKILLRFEVVNDEGLNRPGLVIDDVEIPEIGFKDDAETDTGWVAEGWIRTINFVPQTFIARLIGFGKDGSATVTRLPINDDNSGRWDIPLSTLNQAVIVVSGMAPKTNDLARFNWAAREK